MELVEASSRVCGRNEKFNVFDLACGFLNNSLKVLAHSLPTSGDYDLWQSMILELCTGPTFSRPRWGVTVQIMLFATLLLLSFFTLKFLKPAQQRWRSTWYTAIWVSTKVFHVFFIAQDLFAAGLVNYPKNYPEDPEVVRFCSVCCFRSDPKILHTTLQNT